MLNLREEFIQVKEGMNTWEEAVKLAANPLLENNYIENQYIDEMIKNINKNGAYIVIVPGFAMPHAASENGVLKTGISVLKLEKPVMFPEENEIKLVTVLASKDADEHMDNILKLTEILGDEDLLDEIFETNDKARLMELL